MFFFFLKDNLKQGRVAHAWNPRTREGETGIMPVKYS